MSWNEFYTQSKRDYECSEILMRNKYFENSAYLLQQCVEKNLKAMILKLDSQTSPRRLGHLPLIGLLGELNKRLKTAQRNPPGKNITQVMLQVANIVPELQRVLKHIQRYGLETGWKKSLGIELTDREYTEMTCLTKNLEIARVSMARRLIPVFENYRANLDQQSGSSSLAKSLLPLTDIEIQFDQFKRTYRIIDVNGCEVNIHELLLQPFRYMYEILQNNGKSTEVLSLLVLVMFLGTHTDIMIDTFAHETIGRYPRMIGGKSSIRLYEERSDNLAQLSERVKKRLEYTKLVFE